MIVVAVEYLNTRPFIYGITHSAPAALSEGLVLAIPALCAKAFEDGTADIALVPVGALKSDDLRNIITDHCISATGEVATVVLLSDGELSEIRTIYLDAHSRTSVQLVKVLAREFWNIDVRYVDGIPGERLQQGQAMVAIGDKVFELEKLYSHKVDLSEQWFLYTRLPFVFAAWVARTDVGRAAAEQLAGALQFGVDNIEKCLPRDDYFDRNLNYLTKNIEFGLSAAKCRAMQMFLNKIGR